MVLSGEHLFEMTAINDPRQRKDVADVMEELSGFQYFLGRLEIARLEIEAGIETVLGETIEPDHLSLMAQLGLGVRHGRGASLERTGPPRTAPERVRLHDASSRAARLT
jgi:hypothetical protein